MEEKDGVWAPIFNFQYSIFNPACDNSAIARSSPKRTRTSGPPAKPPARVESPAEGGLTDARLGRIVRLLTDHAMVVVSGTKLAAELGTTRGEVWRLVQQLRALGV